MSDDWLQSAINQAGVGRREFTRLTNLYDVISSEIEELERRKISDQEKAILLAAAILWAKSRDAEDSRA
jgi:hypothetical protein